MSLILKFIFISKWISYKLKSRILIFYEISRCSEKLKVGMNSEQALISRLCQIVNLQAGLKNIKSINLLTGWDNPGLGQFKCENLKSQT